MSITFTVSQILLWALVLAFAVRVITLARQNGILYERVVPMGALVTDSGPAVGVPAPRLELPTLSGQKIDIGLAAGKSTQHLFLSPTCPVCKKLLPIIKRIARDEQRWLRVVLSSDGAQPEHLTFYRKAELEAFPYVLSAELGMSYRVSRLPYTVLIDEQGVLRAKGLVNSREQLESLFTAKEIGVASVQAYIGGHEHA